ncbi:MAG TPA: IS1634 family transposase, partial [Chitinophagaceae bacterium]|nr:IS1634 family transposase [Chitinophagaceae bacterium]
MFLKAMLKKERSTGVRHIHYRLCESYRVHDTVRHHTILHLGPLDDLPKIEQKKALVARIVELIKDSRTGKKGLFVAEDSAVEFRAQESFRLIKENNRLDFCDRHAYQVVDTDSVKNRDVREVGCEWLCMQALQQLGLSSFLSKSGWSQDSIDLALTHIISRASYPASELRTSKWIKENSSVCELTQYPREDITKDKLYKISHRLYAIKNSLEAYLSKRTTELFDLDDKIILYDLTNTYFEGSMRTSKIARFGRSKEKRNDAKIIVLAVVVNIEGFLKYSQIFDGNLADSQSLEPIIEELSIRTSQLGRKPIVVMDAGIASEENLSLLRAKGYDYVCVSRSGLKKYKIDTRSKVVQITDKRNQPITLQRVIVKGSRDAWLKVHSEAKAMKESGMNGRFSERYEQGLNQIQEGIMKKGGTKKESKVWERIGRLKQKYPSVHKFYDVELKTQGGGVAMELTWARKKQPKTMNREGQYLLRTTLDEKKESVQWKIYNVIREIESTFRVLKTDLDLRPIYHKTDDAVMAHLHLGLLAYWIVNTIRHQLKQKGIHNEWRDIARTMNTQKLVTTTMETQYDEHIVIRQCSEPTPEVLKIYNALKYKHRPFTRKKSVVPPPETRKK